MENLSSRQVHLDFHTSEFIPGIGSKFEKDNFKKALKIGNVNSITIFAKCHHSWCYYPTDIGMVHPTMKKGFDFTGAMMEAAHEIGVKAPVYITVGWSANDAENHPEWVCRDKYGNPLATPDFNPEASPDDKRGTVSWQFLCPSGGYAEHIYSLTEEICDRYKNLDGLFYDINFLNEPCYCDNCRDGIAKMNMNIENNEHVIKYNVLKWKEFMESCIDILNKRHPDASYFFNGGARASSPEYHYGQTHFELEDLPTTWGGYDKMPLRAKYFARTGKDYMGMTGKFHTMWGEFGGFKYPDALKYECAAMLTYGARCSIGDQMHPEGFMDMETYRTIGHVYNYVGEIEEYCFNTEVTTRLGVVISDDKDSNEGLTRMLLEGSYDFDIAVKGDDLSRFDTIVLPDCVHPDVKFTEDLENFIENGGSLLLTGTSGLKNDMSSFALDVGAVYEGEGKYDIDYVVAEEKLCKDIVKSPFLFYESASRVTVTDGNILAKIHEPYFNRTYGQYCSHQNTPYRPESAKHPAAIQKGRVIYLAHKVCRMYKQHGAKYHRDYFLNTLKLIYTRPVMDVRLPSAGRARFIRQPSQSRYILHLLYASPIRRGRAEVIEDMPPLYEVSTELIVNEEIKRVYLAPQNRDIPYRQTEKKVHITVPEVKCHQIVVLDY